MVVDVWLCLVLWENEFFGNKVVNGLVFEIYCVKGWLFIEDGVEKMV